jgi:predicted N-acetyltransferase YhbS
MSYAHAEVGWAHAVSIRPEQPIDEGAREALLDAAMGPIRFKRSSERLREGRLPAIALSALQGCADSGKLVGTVRLWQARTCGLSHALMLGPLAVDQSVRSLGIGSALMQAAIAQARLEGHQAIVLVGDEPWYGQFGFRARHAHRLAMPGPFERHRLLGLPLEAGSLERAHGVLRPTGLPVSLPVSLVTPIAQAA